MPLVGLPVGLRQYASFADTSYGWVVATSNGVLCQNGGSWNLLQVPGGSEVTAVVPLGDGKFLAAGFGFCSAYNGRAWQSIPIEDEIYAGAAFEGAAFLSGRHGIYRVSAAGKVEQILSITAERNVYLHVIRGRLYAFAVERGALVWTGSKLEPAENMAWANNATVLSVQELVDGRLFAYTSKGLFMIQGSTITPVCANLFGKIGASSPVNVTVFGDHLIASMYYGGVVSISIATGELEWLLNREAIGGNVYFACEYAGGLLIGLSGGVYLLHDPERFNTLPLPTGDVLFVSHIANGVRVGLTAGTFTVSGSSVLPWEPVHKSRIRSAAELGDGTLVFGSSNRLEINSKVQELEGREIDAIAVLPTGKIALMQPHGISLIGDDAMPHLLPIHEIPTSLVAYENGFLIGTTSGVVRISADGGEQGHFGHGISKVFSCGKSVVGADSDGVLYDGNGQLLGTTPAKETVGAAEWRGDLYLLSRVNDGTTWLAKFDLKSKEWHPLDVPLPDSPCALAVDGDNLLVIAPETVFSLKKAEPLPLPRLEVRLSHIDGRTFSSSDHLTSAEGSIELRFPTPRLGGWRNPQYDIRVGDGPWEAVTIGTIQIPRLTFGRNKIAIRAAWGGLEASTEIIVRRAWPWWARWPMFVVYALLLVGLGYGFVHWRTRSLERRARQLGQMVQERTAELVSAQKAREEFFSTVSHEIRNPLNGVVGLCEILNEAPRDAVAPRERMFVRTLRDCADQLRTILDDVLDFTKIDRGEIQFNDEVFDARSVVEGAVRTVDVSLERCTVDIALVDGWLRGDVGKIRQIVINLVTNALKYGVPSAAKIVATMEMLANGKASLKVVVANMGPTIPEAELARIFEGFTRGRDALARRIPGSGIGLAVSKRIATAMGGNLSLTSLEGLTQFTLVLELAPGIPPQPSEKRLTSKRSGSKALAIEDEPYNRLVLGSILEQLGYEVDWAADGGTALQKAQTTAYDLVLTDYMLPDIDGATLARKLLALMREPKPPIIAVTAYSTPEKIAEAKAAGITGYVVKPISLRKIESAITSSPPVVRIHSTHTPESQAHCDFSMLMRLDNGKALIAEYGADLSEAWNGVAALLGNDPFDGEKTARASHAFRSRLLAVLAEEVAEQVGLFEEAARRGDREICQQLAEVIDDMVGEVAEAAKRHAVALS
jgi:signal transduction histidine kinase/FixJ family two-component response regulator/outer membrane protein assembly factor BamB